MAVIGAVVGALGSVVSGVMAMQQADYQAEVAKMNEKIAKQNANRALNRSQIEQEDMDRQTRVTLGDQEAAQGASGLSLTGKSAIRTRAAARALGRRDALNVRQAGEIEAYNYRTQAVNFKAEGEAAKMSGRSSLLGSFFNAAGSLIGAAGSIGNSSTYSQGPYATSPIFKPRPSPTRSSFGPNPTYLNPYSGMFGGGV